MYSTKILLDSISPAGRRLTTWELTYPRFIHAELMTHREFSRCSASSRAIPSEKMLARIMEDPALPVFWGANQKGMQAAEELPPEIIEQVKAVWLRLRDQAVASAQELAALGLHKQLSNRVTEPWMFITVIVSSTSYDNFFHLRDHWQAQPEFAWIAHDMHEKIKLSEPQKLEVGQWHTPLVFDEDRILAQDRALTDGVSLVWLPFETGQILKKVSVGRVARVSYLTHEGKRDLAEDLALHDRLLAGTATGDPIHMSPFEHVAQALADPSEQSGNFRGWGQYRKQIAGECFGGARP